MDLYSYIRCESAYTEYTLAREGDLLKLHIMFLGKLYHTDRGTLPPTSCAVWQLPRAWQVGTDGTGGNHLFSLMPHLISVRRGLC